MVENGGIKQKNVAVQGKNRRVLNDIGNLVTIRDVEGKVQRPITRSFGAKLLANAQVAVENKSKNECRPCDYMASQPEINGKMRAILVDWLIEVHEKFNLLPETLYLSINLADRFLSLKAMPGRELQLLGIGCMLIACKYEEIWAPEIQNMVYFLAELALIDYGSISFCSSMIAASAVYVARLTLHKSPAWTATLGLYTGFSESQLMECAKMLANLHSGAPQHYIF